MKTSFLTMLVLLFAGCATPYTESPLPEDHPANPAAAESSLPQRSRTLDLSLADPITALPTPSHERDMGVGTAHEDHACGPAAAKPADAAVYTCPMHPEVISNVPERCPKCNMKLVPKMQEGGQK